MWMPIAGNLNFDNNWVELRPGAYESDVFSSAMYIDVLPQWTEYRVSVSMRFTADATSGEMGIVYNVRDRHNFDFVMIR